MYSVEMERNMQKLQYNMNQFSKYLTSVQNGTKSFDDIKQEIEEIKNELSQIKTNINTLQPSHNLITLHNTVKEGCDSYIQGINEFLKFYIDGNDEHFITGGITIQKGTKLMYKASNMF